LIFPAANDGFMTWIKICGTTNLDDALLAVDAGADALGFVFYEKSPRYISPEAAKEIIAKLPAEIQKVGVFAGPSMARSAEISLLCGLTDLQFHVSELSQLGAPHTSGAGGVKRIFWVFSAPDLMGDEPKIHMDFSSIGKLPLSTTLGFNPMDTVFLDSGTPQQPGGTGRTFDWEKAVSLVERMKEGVKVVVAGGLNPSNVIDAIRILKPWGVDVVSGVEASPGKKDPEKVRAFIRAVRQSEKIS
jgi:phosphoribosylanthranilate isomerase